MQKKQSRGKSSSTTSKKPKAEDRTIGLFSGQTPQEERAGYEVEEYALVDRPEKELSPDEWRERAYSFEYGPAGPARDVIRLSRDWSGLYYLERVRADNGGKVWSITGWVLAKENIRHLAKAFLEAAKYEEKNAKVR